MSLVNGYNSIQDSRVSEMRSEEPQISCKARFKKFVDNLTLGDGFLIAALICAIAAAILIPTGICSENSKVFAANYTLGLIAGFSSIALLMLGIDAKKRESRERKLEAS